MYNQADASNAITPSKFYFFGIFLPFPMTYFKLMSLYLTRFHFLMIQNFYISITL